MSWADLDSVPKARKERAARADEAGSKKEAALPPSSLSFLEAAVVACSCRRSWKSGLPLGSKLRRGRGVQAHGLADPPGKIHFLLLRRPHVRVVH